MLLKTIVCISQCKSTQQKMSLAYKHYKLECSLMWWPRFLFSALNHPKESPLDPTTSATYYSLVSTKLEGTSFLLILNIKNSNMKCGVWSLHLVFFECENKDGISDQSNGPYMWGQQSLNLFVFSLVPIKKCNLYFQNHWKRRERLQGRSNLCM